MRCARPPSSTIVQFCTLSYQTDFSTITPRKSAPIDSDLLLNYASSPPARLGEVPIPIVAETEPHQLERPVVGGPRVVNEILPRPSAFRT